MKIELNRLRFSLAGMILPSGTTILQPLTDAELARLEAEVGDFDDTFCDDPSCLCRAQVMTTGEPEGGA